MFLIFSSRYTFFFFQVTCSTSRCFSSWPTQIRKVGNGGCIRFTRYFYSYQDQSQNLRSCLLTSKHFGRIWRGSLSLPCFSGKTRNQFWRGFHEETDLKIARPASSLSSRYMYFWENPVVLMDGEGLSQKILITMLLKRRLKTRRYKIQSCRTPLNRDQIRL